MSLIRVLRTASATLTRTFYVDEAATDLTAPPAVAVTRADGTPVPGASGTAVDAPGTGVYTFTLPGGPAAPGSATWQLDTLTVAWTGVLAGATVTVYDTVEVVGGFLFGLAEGRAADSALADPVKYPTSLLAAKRLEVETECERITGRAWVPRFARQTLNGPGRDTLSVRWPFVRAVRAVTVGGTALTGADLAGITSPANGVLTRPGGRVWPAGVANVVVEYEHGLDGPPTDLVDAALRRFRSKVTAARSGIPDRATSFTVAEGGTYRLATPSRNRTGIPDVDAVYESYPPPLPGFA